MKYNGSSSAYVSSKKTQYDECPRIDNELGLYIIADGVTHPAGAWAANLVCQVIHEAVKKHINTVREGALSSPDQGRGKAYSLLIGAIQLANKTVLHEAKKDPHKIGATSAVVAALCLNDFTVVAHVGNSRAYLLRDQGSILLTKDHTFYQELMDSEGEGPVKINLDYKKSLSRALGMKETVLVTYRIVPMSPEDQLLLCSDGLSNHFSENADELKGILQQIGGADQLTSAFNQFLSKAASKDNATFAVISVTEDANQFNQKLGYIGIKEKIECLKTCPIFRGIWGLPDELMKVAGLLTVRTVGVGEEVVHAGDPSDEMYISLSGSAETLVQGQIIAKNTKAGLIGEMGFLTQRSRTATVRAVEPMQLLTLSRKDFYKLLHQDKDLVIKFTFGVIEELSKKIEASAKELAKRKNSESGS